MEKKKKLFCEISPTTYAISLQKEIIKRHIKNFLSKEIFRQALLLFERNCDFSIPYRSIGVAVSDLSYNKESVQTDLFDTNPSYSLKQKKEELAIQEVRRRFGKDVIAPLRLYEDGNLSKVRNKNQTISERSKL